jgi:1-deoxy-D-xylulose-5-phosphate synthase
LKETNGEAKDNIFKALGFEYIYVGNGNNVGDLIRIFKKVKGTNHPVAIHLNTLKGMGLVEAENNKETFHYVAPHILDSKPVQIKTPETYNDITNNYILNEIKKNNKIAVISPATPGIGGLNSEMRKLLGEHYVDVGIAEQHAVAFCSGIANNGGKPILQITSSFIQRAYDQLSQDLALNNSPAVILVYWGAISSSDATHLGVFDIPLISNIPNIVYLAPTNKEEYLAMLDWSIRQTKHSIAIRVPASLPISSGIKDGVDYSNLNKFKVTKRGKEIALIGVGNFYSLAESVADYFDKKHGVNATLINPCYLTGLDKDLLENLKADHKLVATMEDGVVEGGFGQKIASFYGNSNIKVLNFGATKDFTDSISLNDLYNRYHLTKELIVEDITKSLK